MSRNRKIIIGAILLAGASMLFYAGMVNNNFLRPALTTAGIFDRGETPDHLVGRCTTIVDDQGNMISMMSRVCYAGDEIYTAEGHHYRIESVDGDKALVRFMGMDQQIVAYNDFYANQEAPVASNLAERRGTNVAVYHTHSAESYVPTDGRDSIPFKGGIYQVGKSMVNRLQGKGVNINYDETPHDPHDNNAYVRSRRTAANLMKDNPGAIIDVHRDGVQDPGFYRAKIAGQDVARLRLVVGRENPRMSANMDFARRTMAAANNLHPNIVKEIFVGRGDYNQDLMPTALLIEAGTHTNTREEAERGVAMFAEAIPNVLGIAAPGPAGPTAPGAGGRPGAAAGGAWRAVGWILGVIVVGGLAFLLISSGSWENTKKRLSGFGKEFTSFFGPSRLLRRMGKAGAAPDRKKLPDNYDPNANDILKENKDELRKD